MDPEAARHQRVGEDDVVLGKRLRAIRKAKGVTMDQLADRLGVKAPQIQKYERGANRISALRLNAISLFLQTPIDHFLSDFRSGEPGVPTAKDRENAEMAGLFDRLGGGMRIAVLALIREIVARRGV